MECVTLCYIAALCDGGCSVLHCVTLRHSVMEGVVCCVLHCCDGGMRVLCVTLRHSEMEGGVCCVLHCCALQWVLHTKLGRCSVLRMSVMC